MGLLGRVWGGMKAMATNFGSSLSQPQQWFVNFATGNVGADVGPPVNEFTAFNYLSVFNCVGLISSVIARMPLVTYRGDERERTAATDRPEYEILLWEFNSRMSAMTGREAGIAHLLTWGNSYAQIVRDRRGRLLSLEPIGPDVVKVRIDRGEMLYDIYQRGESRLLRTLPADEMLHVPGLSFDGSVGYSPIRIAKSAIRAGMSQDKEAEKFVTRGIRPPGAIKFPPGKKFKDKQHAIQWRDEFRKIHSNEDGALNVLVLEDGADWTALGIDPVAAQLLESRKYSRKEIAGMYRVPPHLIGDVESSSSWGTGIAEQTQGWVDFCLLDWTTRVEQEYRRKLFRDDRSLYCRHNFDELLRGDLLKRSQAREIQHRRGIVTDNEWRHMEHLNPVEGGDVRHFPLNEGRIDEDGVTLPLPQGSAKAGFAQEKEKP